MPTRGHHSLRRLGDQIGWRAKPLSGLVVEVPRVAVTVTSPGHLVEDRAMGRVLHPQGIDLDKVEAIAKH